MEEQLAWMYIFRIKVPTGKWGKNVASFLSLQSAWKNWLQCVIHHSPLTNKSWRLLVPAATPLQSTLRNLIIERQA